MRGAARGALERFHLHEPDEDHDGQDAGAGHEFRTESGTGGGEGLIRARLGLDALLVVTGRQPEFAADPAHRIRGQRRHRQPGQHDDDDGRPRPQPPEVARP